MTRQTLLATIATLSLLSLQELTNAQLLGSANSFAALGGAAVTNTGPSALTGDLGVGVGNSITGFPPGTFTGVKHNDDAVSLLALADAGTAYNILAGEQVNEVLSGQNLGGLTLTPGVYSFFSSAFLTGTLTLDDEGNPNAIFDFEIGSTLITASNSAVKFLDSGAKDANVYWQIGSSATLGTGTSFAGHIIAAASVTLDTGATIVQGDAIALTGTVSLNSNSISVPASTPEPAPLAVMGMGVAGLIRKRMTKQKR